MTNDTLTAIEASLDQNQAAFAQMMRDDDTKRDLERIADQLRGQGHAEQDPAAIYAAGCILDAISRARIANLRADGLSDA